MSLILFLLTFLFDFAIVGAEFENQHPAYKYKSESNRQISDTDSQEQFVKEYAKNFYLLGQQAFAIGEYKRALWMYGLSYNYQPLNPYNLASRAECHLKMNNYSLTFIDANEALILDSQNESAQKAKALTMIGLGRRTEAIFREIEMMNDKKFAEKLKTDVKKREENKHTSAVLEELFVEAEKHFDAGEFQKAVFIYDNILHHLPFGSETYMNALGNRAYSLENLGKYANAYVDVVEMLALSTDPDYMLQYQKGILLYLLDRHEAISNFERALQIGADSEVAETFNELISNATEKLVHKRQFILDPKMAEIMLADNEIAELIIGHTNNESKSVVSVKFADGKVHEAMSLKYLAELLLMHHSKITRVKLSGVIFTDDVILLLTSMDIVLWTGVFEIELCNFSRLKEADILDLFRNVIRPESLMLTENKGLSSRLLNKAIKEQLLDCTLVILGDSKDSKWDNVALDTNELIEFLHRRRSAEAAILTIDFVFIEGDLINLVEKIVQRFLSDTQPAPFFLHIVRINGDIPLVIKSPLQNKRTMEVMEQEESKIGMVLQRYRSV